MSGVDSFGEFSEYEKDFRAFRKATLDQMEEEMRSTRADSEVEQELARSILDQSRPVFEASGLDFGRLDTIAQSERAKIQERVAEVRRALLSHEGRTADRLRAQVGSALGHTGQGGSQAFLVGADVFATDEEALADYEGERGNPSVWLYDAAKHWKGKAVTSGTPDCSGGTPYHPGGAIWYHVWQPPAKGNYNIYCGTYYHGVHIVLAQYLPPFPFCTYAHVKATVSLRVGIKMPPALYPTVVASQDRSLIDKGGNVVYSTGVLEGSSVETLQVKYNGVGPLYINVVLSLQVTAKGYLTHAELNFKDGTANQVSPPFVIISSAP
jgi:hypothetical protein